MRLPFDARAVFGPGEWREGLARSSLHRDTLTSLIQSVVNAGAVPPRDAGRAANSFWAVFVANTFNFTTMIGGVRAPPADPGIEERAAELREIVTFCFQGLGLGRKAWGHSLEKIIAGGKKSPPLVMFHGVGDNSALMWVYNARELSKHIRLMAVDTMGGAGKSRPDERYGNEFDLSRWLGDVLTALRVDKTFAAGVSYGSYLAQLLQVSFPEKVEKLVCLAGSVAAKGYKYNTF
jgi:pimeloyl-ACP methyl ester carboxylesterase